MHINIFSSEIGWRGRWEGGSGWGIQVTPWLIHVNVWQNPLKCCEVISLQLIKINEKKNKWKKKKTAWTMLFLYMRICTFPYRYFKMGSMAQMIKDFVHNAGDLGTIPGLGRSPGGRYGYPLQYSCQENPMDRGAWQVTVHGVAKSQTWQQLMLLYLKHYSTPGEGNGNPL